jgi:hypothetical protein
MAISLRDLAPKPVAAAEPARPSVMVVSHERSGTHFLINALANAYGYPARDFLDFDQTALSINYFHAPAVADALERAARRPYATTVKSHHTIEFFDGVLDNVLRTMPIFYVHRHPVDVMISYWRIVQAWQWREGPRRMSVVDFAAAEPEGMMMRYQQKQVPNLLHRWAQHVDGWIEAAKTRNRITVVRYDQLCSAYEKTVASFAAIVGKRSGSLVPPDRHTNVITGPAPVHLPAPDREALHALALSEIGETMRRHGYA